MGGTYECPHCPKSFGQKSSLTTHVRLVHEQRRDHVCRYCSAAFKMKYHLTRHVQRKHGTG